MTLFASRPAGLPTKRLLAYQLTIPALALLVFAAFAWLWVSGRSDTYITGLRMIGFKAWYFPFLDTDAVLAAAECHRQGINVYSDNPCDALGRVHVYSPLWLSVIPGFLSTSDTPLVGVILDLVFILCLPIVFRPRSWHEIGIFAVGVLSPTTVYALERGNNDVVIFIMMTWGSLLFGSARYGYRIIAYGIFLMAGLLKYYPFVIFTLIIRERWRREIVLVFTLGVIVFLATVLYRHELILALHNIPVLSYFMATFSAQNFPFGILELLGAPRVGAVKLVGELMLAVFAAAAVASAWKKVHLLGHCAIDWSCLEARHLAIASLLLPACFFAGQNEGYRGVFLLLALSGLVRLRGSTDFLATRRWLTKMIVFCLVIMWGEFFRRHYNALAGLGSAEFAASPIRKTIWILLWFGREAIWWWLISGMLALAVACVHNLWRTGGRNLGRAA